MTELETPQTKPKAVEAMNQAKFLYRLPHPRQALLAEKYETNPNMCQ
jgi:hypothetical protein